MPVYSRFTVNLARDNTFRAQESDALAAERLYLVLFMDTVEVYDRYVTGCNVRQDSNARLVFQGVVSMQFRPDRAVNPCPFQQGCPRF
ncbi:hypothetical protein AB1N83_003018 [Pleurotus pulmonarius]